MYVLNFKGVLKKADLANYELIRRRAYYHRCEICKPGLLAIATVHNHCASDIQVLCISCICTLTGPVYLSPVPLQGLYISGTLLKDHVKLFTTVFKRRL